MNATFRKLSAALLLAALFMPVLASNTLRAQEKELIHYSTILHPFAATCFTRCSKRSNSALPLLFVFYVDKMST